MSWPAPAGPGWRTPLTYKNYQDGIRRLPPGLRHSEAQYLPPQYAKLGDTTMVLRGRVYWRPAGAWEAQWKWVNGVLLSHFPSMPWLHEVPLVEITEEEFMSDNQGYV